MYVNLTTNMRDPRNEDIDFSLGRVWSTNSAHFKRAKMYPSKQTMRTKSTKFICH